MSMRIALFSDVHGNTIALDAVLDDIRRIGVADEYWIVGDIVALGHDPIGAVERIASLPNVHVVRGNTDRYTTTGSLPPIMQRMLAHDPSNIPTALTIARSYGWTCGALSSAGWLTWLEQLPLEHRAVLPDGTILLGVHASPNQDDGEGIHPGLRPEDMRALLHGSAADLLCVGHTHWPLDCTIDGVRVINLGSVSNPFASDLRAMYTIIDAEPRGYQIHHHRVAYDHDAVIAALQRCHHPSAEFLIQYQQGLKHSRWE